MCYFAKSFSNGVILPKNLNYYANLKKIKKGILCWSCLDLCQFLNFGFLVILILYVYNFFKEINKKNIIAWCTLLNKRDPFYYNYNYNCKRY